MGRTNNFTNSTHAELHGTAAGLAGLLRTSADVQDRVLDKRHVTHHQRRLIRTPSPGGDRELADLLDMLAKHVHHGAHIEGDAEQLLKDSAATLLGVIGPKLVALQRNARYHVLLEAANVTLRKRAAEWLDAGEPGQTRHARALASNRGLAEVLNELENLRAAMASKRVRA
ncbi:hypothetical protein [Stenotrophomonas sp. CFBP 13725]|uniref:hypothetical protein n=1 Tax=Stenotrophomonas sp. CFBP 13725 TaxID=2775297 RepID=UPI0017857E80|nr:hypothetical protein [Stenotrophomonas sp. CFBP 13725]MBD8635645.1 hypothetical protein [Stenotrophomonas sp. CFBP 13725]